jgi:hypothetical protein
VGLGFLQAADVIDVDLSDQAARLDAFQRLNALDPVDNSAQKAF